MGSALLLNMTHVTKGFIVLAADNSLVCQPIEVLGSSSATEDSTIGTSVMSSSSHIPVPVQLDDSGR